MPRPSIVPTWATNNLYSGGPAVGTPTKVAPSGADIAEGYEPAQEPGAQGFNYNLNLIGQWISWLNGVLTPIGRQILTASSGTYTPTTGTLAVRARGVGAGGGGGGTFYDLSGTHSAAGAGGASGIYWEKWIFPGGGTLITGGAYVCGAGGHAGLGNTGGQQDGGTGADSTIVIQGVTYTVKGGLGGHGDFDDLNIAAPYIKYGALCQAGSSAGDIVKGDHGAHGFVLVLGGGGPAGHSEITMGGNGGSGAWGVGGSGAQTSNNGTDGTGYGAGGGGSALTESGGTSTAKNGGAGAPGAWIIEEFA